VKDSLLALAPYQNPRHVMFWYGFEPVVNYSVKPLTSVGGLSSAVDSLHDILPVIAAAAASGPDAHAPLLSPAPCDNFGWPAPLSVRRGCRCRLAGPMTRWLLAERRAKFVRVRAAGDAEVGVRRGPRFESGGPVNSSLVLCRGWARKWRGR